MSKGRELFEAATGVSADSDESVLRDAFEAALEKVTARCDEQDVTPRGLVLLFIGRKGDEWMSDYSLATCGGNPAERINALTALNHIMAGIAEDNIDRHTGELVGALNDLYGRLAEED